MTRCDELAACTEEPGRITRSYGTPPLRQRGRLSRDGCVRPPGGPHRRRRQPARSEQAQSPTVPALLLGSHLDSVRDAGRYDGPLGILVALEVVDRFRQDNSPSPSRLK